MESINASDVLEAARKMYSNIKEREKCSGELSWERCYQSFRELQNAARASERLEDEACLSLAVYLASYGMYRGSSFVSRCDASIHRPIVEMLASEEYRELAFRAQKGFLQSADRKRLWKLEKRVSAHYGEARTEVFSWDLTEGTKARKPVGPVSQILVSKILLGTLGCVPAYDARFCKSAKKFASRVPCSLSENSLVKLYEAFSEVEDDLERTCGEMVFLSAGGGGSNDLTYPPVKVIDMGMWCLGGR